MSDQRTQAVQVELRGQEWKRSTRAPETPPFAVGKAFRRHIVVIEPYTEVLAVFGTVATQRAIDYAHAHPPGNGRYHYDFVSAAQITETLEFTPLKR